MAEELHPQPGAEDAQAIWKDLEKAEAAPPDKPNEEPKALEPEGSKPEPKSESVDDKGTAPTAPDASDIWANATPELRAAFEATRTERDTFLRDKRRAEGTVSGLQRKINELSKGAPVKTAATGEKGSPTGAGLDDAELKAAKEQFPEIIGPIEKLVTGQKSEIEKLRNELGGISDAQQKEYLSKQLAIVDEAHPDYDKVRTDPSFRQWYETAPAYLKAGVERNADAVRDGAEVAHIVSTFKLETGFGKAREPAPAGATPQTQAQPDPKRKLQMESSATPKGKAHAVVTAESNSGDPQVIWKQLEAEERRAASR